MKSGNWPYPPDEDSFSVLNMSAETDRWFDKGSYMKLIVTVSFFLLCVFITPDQGSKRFVVDKAASRSRIPGCTNLAPRLAGTRSAQIEALAAYADMLRTEILSSRSSIQTDPVFIYPSNRSQTTLMLFTGYCLQLRAIHELYGVNDLLEAVSYTAMPPQFISLCRDVAFYSEGWGKDVSLSRPSKQVLASIKSIAAGGDIINACVRKRLNIRNVREDALMVSARRYSDRNSLMTAFRDAGFAQDGSAGRLVAALEEKGFLVKGANGMLALSPKGFDLTRTCSLSVRGAAAVWNDMGLSVLLEDARDNDVMLIINALRSVLSPSDTPSGGFCEVLNPRKYTRTGTHSRLSSVAEAVLSAHKRTGIDTVHCMPLAPISNNYPKAWADTGWQGSPYARMACGIDVFEIGTPQELADMVEELSREGIKVLFDIVLHHTGIPGGGKMVFPDQCYRAKNRAKDWEGKPLFDDSGTIQADTWALEYERVVRQDAFNKEAPMLSVDIWFALKDKGFIRGVESGPWYDRRHIWKVENIKDRTVVEQTVIDLLRGRGGYTDERAGETARKVYETLLRIRDEVPPAWVWALQNIEWYLDYSRFGNIGLRFDIGGRLPVAFWVWAYERIFLRYGFLPETYIEWQDEQDIGRIRHEVFNRLKDHIPGTIHGEMQTYVNSRLRRLIQSDSSGLYPTLLNMSAGVEGWASLFSSVRPDWYVFFGSLPFNGNPENDARVIRERARSLLKDRGGLAGGPNHDTEKGLQPANNGRDLLGYLRHWRHGDGNLSVKKILFNLLTPLFVLPGNTEFTLSDSILALADVRERTGMDFCHARTKPAYDRLSLADFMSLAPYIFSGEGLVSLDEDGCRALMMALDDFSKTQGLESQWGTCLERKGLDAGIIVSDYAALHAFACMGQPERVMVKNYIFRQAQWYKNSPGHAGKWSLGEAVDFVRKWHSSWDRASGIRNRFSRYFGQDAPISVEIYHEKLMVKRYDPAFPGTRYLKIEADKKMDVWEITVWEYEVAYTREAGAAAEHILNKRYLFSLGDAYRPFEILYQSA